jgi:hypothetical protein
VVLGGRFCRGFSKKLRFKRGGLVVKTWWFVVSLWFADGTFSGRRKSDRSSEFILALGFGEDVEVGKGGIVGMVGVVEEFVGGGGF